MNETDGRRQRGERARAQVLEHATAIASTDGLEGLTIGRVATDAGVGKGNIQVLFGDKETLQLATLDAGVVHYREMVVEPALALESPLARLRVLTEGWFDYVASGASPGGCFVCAASYEYRARPGAIQDRVRGHREEMRARFRETITAAQAAGELRADVEVDQLVFEIESFRSNANVAFLMGDMAVFERARRSTRARIDAALA
ncbi:TetR/AcrR family transcriptional regulator [Ralstonia sp.]|uniref:TetR/AcrR family transcriptional regulator n=1 Tax=Ralstonia sp. TaxID=54061 RepID=UPI002BAA0298|nr:TetR/AcrR family transcriptional regulator [Ralstonia sp.]HWV04276.1 TetR/AcrR family transcriptional regulator [Ralstonia sp.]